MNYQIEYILQPFNKVWDAHEKRNLEFMFESSPTMIGFNPKWPLSRVEMINVLLLKCILTVWWITTIQKSYLCYIYDSIKAITVTTEIQRIFLQLYLFFWPQFDWNYRYLWNDRYSTHAKQLNLNDFYTALYPNDTSVSLIIVYGCIIYLISVKILRIFKIFQFYNAAPRK